eukprot:365027-Amphidinium_carterae.1
MSTRAPTQSLRNRSSCEGAQELRDRLQRDILFLRNNATVRVAQSVPSRQQTPQQCMAKNTKLSERLAVVQKEYEWQEELKAVRPRSV